VAASEKALIAPNLVSLMDAFASEDRCRLALERVRWPDGVECPNCQSKRVSRIDTRGQLDCNSCRYRFSVKVGTVLHDSHLPLRKWFIATFLMCESKKGMSSLRLSRTLGVSTKTGWYLTHRIRAAMAQNDRPMLEGVVEADDTCVGGKPPQVGAGYIENKVQVLGAIERGGNMSLGVHQKGKRADTETLRSFLALMVSDSVPAIYMDENPGCRGIGDDDTVHLTVNHQGEEWVSGDVHTNPAESAWSLFKRSIVGSYHQLSVKHLEAYLGEFEWRFNNRDNPFLFRDTLRSLVSSQQLTFQELTAEVA
jgi:transposase-like protein